MRTKQPILTIALIVMLFMAACAAPTTDTGATTGSAEGESTAASSDAVPADGPSGTLIAALPLEPNSINPPNGADRMAGLVTMQIFDALMEPNFETGELDPALATEWSVSEDGLTYSFTLREGVTFHDGSEFNADDVVATFAAGVDPANAYAADYEGITVEVDDPLHVRIVRETTDVTYLRRLAETQIISNDQFAEGGNQAIEDAPIGTGAFRFVEWQKGDRIVLEANENYWDTGTPHVAELIFRPIPESSTRLAAVQTGEVDIVNRLSADEAQSLLGVEGVEVVRYPADRVYYIAFNNLSTGIGLPTEDPQVRQAMNYAVNRQAIVDGLFNGFARLSTGFVTPSNLGFDESLEPFPYDPEKAKELLAAAGYADGFEIGMACPIGAYTNFEEVCQAIAADLAAVGITVTGGEVELMESGVYWDKEAVKELPPLFGDSWSASVGEALPRLEGALGGPEQSYSSWLDEEIVNKLAAIGAEFDDEARAELYKELQTYMIENPPFIYLYEPNSFEAITARVEGYTPSSNEQYYAKDISLAQ
ncbi:MAG: ABC transporter substrate-binding protein [Caldilineaceae bacterium]